MRLAKIAIIAAITLTLILIFTNIFNTPKKQDLQDAFISVKTVKLYKNTTAPTPILSEQKNRIEDAIIYSAKGNDISYTVTYVKYKAAGFKLSDAVPVIARMFKNNDFSYETAEFNQGETEGILITGSYILNGQDYGIMAKLFKNENNFWQAIVIYQDSERNVKTAQDFIKSAAIKLQI